MWSNNRLGPADSTMRWSDEQLMLTCRSSMMNFIRFDSPTLCVDCFVVWGWLLKALCNWMGVFGNSVFPLCCGPCCLCKTLCCRLTPASLPLTICTIVKEKRKRQDIFRFLTFTYSLLTDINSFNNIYCTNSFWNYAIMFLNFGMIIDQVNFLGQIQTWLLTWRNRWRLFPICIIGIIISIAV